MALTVFVVVLLGVLLNAGAQLFLKNGTNLLGSVYVNDLSIFDNILRVVFNPSIFLGLICYVISVGVWIYALSKTDVSVAYPMLSIGYVINAVIAYYFFGESLSFYKISGIGIICIGVYLVARS